LRTRAAGGRFVELIDLRTIYPFDARTVVDSVRKTGRLLVVHEEPQTFGVAAEIMATIMEKAFDRLEAPPARLTRRQREEKAHHHAACHSRGSGPRLHNRR
jgi:pyruvate/2-oxoglutarate/acetoin dehydrogenase E1 component